MGRTELDFSEAGAERGARKLFDSLHRTLLAEPDSLTVLPGHVTVTSDGRFANGTPGDPVARYLGDLRTRLDLLSLDRNVRRAIVSRIPDKPPNYESVIDGNRGKRDRPDDEATELELGPNNCAAG